MFPLSPVQGRKEEEDREVTTRRTHCQRQDTRHEVSCKLKECRMRQIEFPGCKIHVATQNQLWAQGEVTVLAARAVRWWDRELRLPPLHNVGVKWGAGCFASIFPWHTLRVHFLPIDLPRNGAKLLKACVPCTKQKTTSASFRKLQVWRAFIASLGNKRPA